METNSIITNNDILLTLKENYIIFISKPNLSMFIVNNKNVIDDKNDSNKEHIHYDTYTKEETNIEYELYALSEEIVILENKYKEYCKLCPKAGKKCKQHHYACIKEIEQQMIDYLKILYL